MSGSAGPGPDWSAVAVAVAALEDLVRRVAMLEVRRDEDVRRIARLEARVLELLDDLDARRRAERAGGPTLRDCEACGATSAGEWTLRLADGRDLVARLCVGCSGTSVEAVAGAVRRRRKKRLDIVGGLG